jgi:hypothetical protein
MGELREIFSFSRSELIALSLLLVLALTGGGILLLERMQQQIPAEIVFQPIEISREQSVSPNSQEPAAKSDSMQLRADKQQRIGIDFKININSAPAESLMLLPHVGRVISSRIISRREAGGRFASPNELIAIRGIGPKYLQEILPFITTE